MTRWLDLLERSAWTFVQSFAASVVVTGGLGIGDLKLALAAAVISVLKNLSVATSVKAGQELVTTTKKK